MSLRIRHAIGVIRLAASATATYNKGVIHPVTGRIHLYLHAACRPSGPYVDAESKHLLRLKTAGKKRLVLAPFRHHKIHRAGNKIRNPLLAVAIHQLPGSRLQEQRRPRESSQELGSDTQAYSGIHLHAGKSHYRSLPRLDGCDLHVAVLGLIELRLLEIARTGGYRISPLVKFELVF